MAKLTLTDLGTTLANTAATVINTNDDRIEAAFENTLSRDGTGPNQMEADLDINNNDILNVNSLEAESLTLGGQVVVPTEMVTIPATIMLKATYDPLGVGQNVFDRKWQGDFDTVATFQATQISSVVQWVFVAGYYNIGDGGAHFKKRIAAPVPAEPYHSQSADGAWWETIFDGAIDLLKFGLKGDGTNESALFTQALEAATDLGFNKVICTDKTRQFKLVEVEITDDVEIDLHGGMILGDFDDWGLSSVDSTPIYWTKNVFFSVEANAPSVTLKNLTLDGQSDPAFQMAGGTPIIDFRGSAAAGNVKVVLDNFVFTRGANRIYTTGSGISPPTLALDFRNMEILLYNIDDVRINDVVLRSSPGEMLQIQSDDARTRFYINNLYATKARDSNPASKWSSSALNILNCHQASQMRDSFFYFFIKGPVNWQMHGGIIENCHFNFVDDSNGLDFNEAGAYRFNNHTVRNCFFKDIVNVGIRTSGSNELFENNVFVDVDFPIRFEAGVLGDPAKGAWYLTNQVALVNNTVRNNNVISMNAAHTNKREIYCTGVSSSIYIELHVDGGSLVDRQPTSKKSLFGIYALHTKLSLSGYFGNGTTALVYMEGTGTCFARDCYFEPESGESAHVFELNAVTMGKKALVLQNCTRLTALDGGNFDFRNTGATLDIDTIHINFSPNFAGTTNNAVISRDGFISGSATYDPASIAAGASASTTVTVTGARLAVNDTVKVSPSITPAGLIVHGAVTATNVVTVTYFNPTAGAIDLASHTITAYVAKAPS